MKISLKKLEACRADRPAGYVEELLAAGQIEGDWLLIEQSKLSAIVARHTPDRKIVGHGDRVAAFAQPIARLVDAVVKTSLETCGACAKRKERYNQNTIIKP